MELSLQSVEPGCGSRFYQISVILPDPDLHPGPADPDSDPDLYPYNAKLVARPRDDLRFLDPSPTSIISL